MTKSAIAKCEVGSLKFLHPSDWVVEANETEDGPSVSLQSPGASFAIVAAFPADADPEIVVDQAMETLREEHPGLEIDDDADELDPKLANEPHAVVLEAVFFSLDTLSYCWLSSWRLTDATVFVMLQSTDRERAASLGVFRGICQTIESVHAK